MSVKLDSSLYKINLTFYPDTLKTIHKKNLDLYNGILSSYEQLPDMLNKASIAYRTYKSLVEKCAQNNEEIEKIDTDSAIPYFEDPELENLELSQIGIDANEKMKILSVATKALLNADPKDVVRAHITHAELLGRVTRDMQNLFIKYKTTLAMISAGLKDINAEIETQTNFLKKRTARSL